MPLNLVYGRGRGRGAGAGAGAARVLQPSFSAPVGVYAHAPHRRAGSGGSDAYAHVLEKQSSVGNDAWGRGDVWGSGGGNAAGAACISFEHMPASFQRQRSGGSLNRPDFQHAPLPPPPPQQQWQHQWPHQWSQQGEPAVSDASNIWTTSRIWNYSPSCIRGE